MKRATKKAATQEMMPNSADCCWHISHSLSNYFILLVSQARACLVKKAHESAMNQIEMKKGNQSRLSHLDIATS